MNKNNECNSVPIGYVYEDILNNFKGNSPDTYFSFDEVERLNSDYPELVQALKKSPILSKYVKETFILPKTINGADTSRHYIKAKQ